MSIAKLLKLAPTLILICFLGYASYSLHQSLPKSPSVGPDAAKSLEAVGEMLVSSTVEAERLIGELRDPFLVRQPPVLPDAPPATANLPSEAPPDPLAAVVRGLTLEATFFQGRDQIAIIDGRIYYRGQRLRFRNDPQDLSAQLFLAVVQPTKVILRGNNRSYVLSYPDQLGKRPDSPGPGIAGTAEQAMLDPSGQLAVIRKLLDSPLGALGRSIVGESALMDPLSRNAQAPRRRSPSPRSGSRSSRTGNP